MSETAMDFLESLDQHTRSMVKNMMKSIFNLGENYVEFVRDFNDKNGFLFSGGKKMDNIMDNEIVIRDGHSGCSASITMRNCQYMLEKYPRNDIETGLFHESSDKEPETLFIKNNEYGVERQITLV
jgi:hypothetical protein